MQRFSGLIRRGLIVAVVAAAGLVGSAGAQQAPGGQARMTPAEIPWPKAAGAGAGTSGASGISTIVLKGDPTKPGLYVLELRAAPNMVIQAHSHKDDRMATVLKGTWYFGYGDKYNEAALKALPVGSYYTEPPNTPHFARTRDEVVLRITGYGPTSTTYVNPADDPANAAKK
jgi:quercetin dioxygenase-like cupin family protein